MIIYTLTYLDDDGVYTEVFNSIEDLNRAATNWVEGYKDIYPEVDFNQTWPRVFNELCDQIGFSDVINQNSHMVSQGVTSDPFEQAYLQTAKNQLGRDGECEFDDNAAVSVSENGAYVQGWIWVDDAQVETPMAIVESNGTTWYFDNFEEFMTAVGGAPPNSFILLGTPEHLEKSGGVNDAWEFLTADDDSLKLEDISIYEMQRRRSLNALS